ncbi:MAG TPA: hypothetical protein VFX86_04730 [Candidatus Saccharimonadales bacterium]|nr:hypothetical protein [Candidatus Saccharimonadales bacterium]
MSPDERAVPVIDEHAAYVQKKLSEDLFVRPRIDEEESIVVQTPPEEKPVAVEFAPPTQQVFEQTDEGSEAEGKEPSPDVIPAEQPIEPPEPIDIEVPPVTMAVELAEESQTQQIVNQPPEDVPDEHTPLLDEGTADFIAEDEPAHTYPDDDLPEKALPAVEPAIITPIEGAEAATQPEFPVTDETIMAEAVVETDDEPMDQEAMIGEEPLMTISEDIDAVSSDDSTITEPGVLPTGEPAIEIDLFEELIGPEVSEEANLILEEIEDILLAEPDESEADTELLEEDELQQELKRLVVRLFETVDIEHDEQFVELVAQEMIDEQEELAVGSASYNQDVQERGTRESKPKPYINMIVQKLKQKFKLHISLGRFVIRKSIYETAYN